MIKQKIAARPQHIGFKNGAIENPLQQAFDDAWIRHHNDSFPVIVHALRSNLGLGQRSFARTLDIGYGFVAGWESGRKVCGPEPAERMADRIGLVGSLRDLFLYKAATTVHGAGVIRAAAGYPPAVLDAVARLLRHEKIGPDAIEEVRPDVGAPVRNGSGSSETCLTIKVRGIPVLRRCRVILEHQAGG